MTGLLQTNLDYLIFAAVTVAVYAGISVWLKRSRLSGGLPAPAWVFLAVALTFGWFATGDAGERVQRELREKISLSLPTYAREFQRLGHATLADHPPADDPKYLELIETQVRWLGLNPFITDIYTFRRTHDGRVILLVDSETDFDRDGRLNGTREGRTAPGETYPKVTEAMLAAFGGRSAFDESLRSDRWGTWVSAFEPLRDADGRVEAVIGVDFEADRWSQRTSQARLLVILRLAVLAGLVGAGAGIWSLMRQDMERRQASALRAAEQAQLLRLVFDQAPSGITLSGPDSRYIEANPTACRMLGYSLDELRRLTFIDVTHPEDVDSTLAVTRRLVGNASTQETFEKRYRRKDGSELTAITSVGVIRDAKGEPQYFVAQILDTTGRTQAEARLRAQQLQLENVLGTAELILFATDRDGRLLLSEGAGPAALAGRFTRAVGENLFEAFGNEPRLLGDLKCALSGESTVGELEMDGSIFETHLNPMPDARGNVAGAIGLAFDVTERRRSDRERESVERTLLETQRIDSLGLLAGNVAHDFNNLLTAMIGNVALARLNVPDGSAAHGNLELVEETARTAADLCRQLLAFSGRGSVDSREVDPGSTIGDSAGLLRVSLGNNTRLDLQLGPAPTRIKADPGQIKQAVLNLVINAAEAIGERPATITISTREQSLSREWFSDAKVGAQLPAGSYVCVEVADDGPGIAAGDLGRIFDPFFSTKPNGRGLGLAAVLGIVRVHGGALKVRSSAGAGTVFTLAFPMTSKPSPDAAVAATTAAASEGGPRVLIVDDESAVRSTTAQMAEYFGFAPIEVESGEAALETLRSGARVDVVLLDVTMPGMDGVETLLEMRKTHPELPVVIFSGFSKHDTLPRFAGQHYSGFLQKPFPPDVLNNALLAALRGRA